MEESPDSEQLSFEEFIAPARRLLERDSIWKVQIIGPNIIVVESKVPDKTIERPRIMQFIDALEALPGVRKTVTITDDRTYKITVETK